MTVSRKERKTRITVLSQRGGGGGVDEREPEIAEVVKVSHKGLNGRPEASQSFLRHVR